MSVTIRAATLTDKQDVLALLDEFNDFAHAVDGHDTASPSTFSRQHSGELFESIVHSDQSKIFVAILDQKFVGFLEIHQVPRLRKANYYAEIESMYVREANRGSGVASDLMQFAIEWAREQKLDCIRLYTGHKLERAHSFYEKMGFIHAGRTYKYSL